MAGAPERIPYHARRPRIYVEDSVSRVAKIVAKTQHAGTNKHLTTDELDSRVRLRLLRKSWFRNTLPNMRRPLFL
jgi:hypothetical protein